MTRNTFVGLATAGALIGIVGAAVYSRPTPAKIQQARVKRGQYLVTVGGCNDCHTPLKIGPKGPEPDTARMLSGHPDTFPITAGPTPPSEKWLMTMAASGSAFSGPWGVSFAANLTPDQNTGLGIWTEDMFIRTVRTGRHMGVSRPILPPMPWVNVGAMTDEDLKSVYAYLRTIPPVHNRVPVPIPPMPEQTAENRPDGQRRTQ
jgi:hypothetical protein